MRDNTDARKRVARALNAPRRNTRVSIAAITHDANPSTDTSPTPATTAFQSYMRRPIKKYHSACIIRAPAFSGSTKQDTNRRSANAILARSSDKMPGLHQRTGRKTIDFPQRRSNSRMTCVKLCKASVNLPRSIDSARGPLCPPRKVPSLGVNVPKPISHSYCPRQCRTRSRTAAAARSWIRTRATRGTSPCTHIAEQSRS